MTDREVNKIVDYVWRHLGEIYDIETLKQLAKEMDAFEPLSEAIQMRPNVHFLLALNQTIRSIVPWYARRVYMLYVQRRILERLLDT